MPIRVRELRPSDMQAYRDLCMSRESLMSGEAADRRAEVVEWLAFHNPFDDGKPTYFVGDDGDRLVAHIGRMPTIFSIGGELESACFWHDLFVHPEIRQMGAQGFFLSMRLYKYLEQSTPSFGAMIWTNDINIALQKARKYDQMWIDRRVLVLGLKEKIQARAPASLQPPLEKVARGGLELITKVSAGRSRAHYTAEEIERFDERFDELAEMSAPNTGIAPRKGSKYLNWKYSDRPHLDARYFQLLDRGGSLVGFCVVTDPDSSGTSALAEIQVADNDPEKIRALLKCAIQHARGCQAERIEASSSLGAYAAEFHRALFRRNQRIPLFLANAEASSHYRSLKRPSHWHICMGDSEGPF